MWYIHNGLNLFVEKSCYTPKNNQPPHFRQNIVFCIYYHTLIEDYSSIKYERCVFYEKIGRNQHCCLLSRRHYSF